jgi:hypothetical protein
MMDWLHLVEIQDLGERLSHGQNENERDLTFPIPGA